MNHGKTFYIFCMYCAVCAVISCTLTGCKYMSIPVTDDIQAGVHQKGSCPDMPVYNSAVIKGKFIGMAEKRAATLIAAYRSTGNGDAEYTGYATLTPSGSFMLYLPEGRYLLYSLTDYNDDGILQNNEISGIFGSVVAPREIALAEGALVTNIDIHASGAGRHILRLPGPFPLREYLKIPRKVTYNGQILKIYSEYFSVENAQTGYWHPTSFMQTFGAHIYLTEKYDQKKIPVLFVHGTKGSPHNWIYLCMRLDRTRYQPLFYYYPSGIRLSLSAAILNEELRELRQQYGFQKMVVVAHSVGGLVSRAFISRYVSDGHNDFINLFVTFATPWSGFEMADASQQRPHKSIPAWADLGPQSSFIQKTMNAKLPAHLRHYIFYGTNDVLSADKATDERAVSCAVKSLGFDCTHDTILIKRSVFEKFNAILEKELR